jgi:hypothetical protein
MLPQENDELRMRVRQSFFDEQARLVDTLVEGAPFIPNEEVKTIAALSQAVLFIAKSIMFKELWAGGGPVVPCYQGAFKSSGTLSALSAFMTPGAGTADWQCFGPTVNRLNLLMKTEARAGRFNLIFVVDPLPAEHRAYQRPDAIFVAFDLRENALEKNIGPHLSGVTIPAGHPSGFIRGWNHTIPSLLALGWAGKCANHDGAHQSSHRARSHLATMMRRSKAPERGKLSLRCTEARGAKFITNDARRSETLSYPNFLATSDFSLVLHGHRRWSYRLSEVVSACSVPVIIADGLTLPCEQLIDWSIFSVRISEADFYSMEQVADITALLPTDPVSVRKMRHHACAVKNLYFDTVQARQRCLYLSAASLVSQKRGGRELLLNESTTRAGL